LPTKPQFTCVKTTTFIIISQIATNNFRKKKKKKKKLPFFSTGWQIDIISDAGAGALFNDRKMASISPFGMHKVLFSSLSTSKVF